MPSPTSSLSPGVPMAPAQGRGHRDTTDERGGHPDQRDQDRCPAHGAQLSQVELEADFQQQQHDAELAEHLEHGVVGDQAEHRRADQNAGGDLADHGRDAGPLGHLSRHLGRDEHDEHVEEDAADVESAVHGWAPWRDGRSRCRPGFPALPAEMVAVPGGSVPGLALRRTSGTASAGSSGPLRTVRSDPRDLIHAI